MPWEAVIFANTPAPPSFLPSNPSFPSLGVIADVEAEISTVLPAIQFFAEPSGRAKLAATEALGLQLPPLLRMHLESSPSARQGEFEGVDATGQAFSIHFNLGAGPVVERLDLEVRGSGDPGRHLGLLLEATRWHAYDLSTGALLTEAGRLKSKPM